MSDNAPGPLVEVVIPVHSPTRPIGRAVDSAVAAVRGLGPSAAVITVVAHHLDPEQIRAVLTPAQCAAVRIITCPDEGHTAAVPRNTALERTEARYISFLDSDDTLDPDAVTRWTWLAEHLGSDLVLPFQYHANGRADFTPISRPGRTRKLDAVADRLVYRSTCFGLVRVRTARALGSRFDSHVRTGEDLSFVTSLHAGAKRIDLAEGLPGYCQHHDATDRVSRSPLPVAEQLAPALRAAREPWWEQTSPQLREALVAKVLRINCAAAVEAHLEAGTWDETEARASAEMLTHYVALAPRVLGMLSRADRAAFEALADPQTSPTQLRAALQRRRRFLAPSSWLTASGARVFDRNAPLRTNAAAAWRMARYRWATR